jgi:hypothetical protein
LLAGLISCVPTVTHAKYVTFVGALFRHFSRLFLREDRKPRCWFHL